MFYSEDNNLDSISETFSSDTDNGQEDTNLSLMSILENCRQQLGGSDAPKPGCNTFRCAQTFLKDVSNMDTKCENIEGKKINCLTDFNQMIQQANIKNTIPEKLDLINGWAKQYGIRISANDVITGVSIYLNLITQFISQIRNIAFEIFSKILDGENLETFQLISNLKKSMGFGINLHDIFTKYNEINEMSSPLKDDFNEYITTKFEIKQQVDAQFEQLIKLKFQENTNVLFGMELQPNLHTLFELGDGGDGSTFSGFAFDVIPRKLKDIIEHLRNIVPDYSTVDHDNTELTNLLKLVIFMRELIDDDTETVDKDVMDQLNGVKYTGDFDVYNIVNFNFEMKKTNLIYENHIKKSTTEPIIIYLSYNEWINDSEIIEAAPDDKCGWHAVIAALYFIRLDFNIGNLKISAPNWGDYINKDGILINNGTKYLPGLWYSDEIIQYFINVVRGIGWEKTNQYKDLKNKCWLNDIDLKLISNLLDKKYKFQYWDSSIQHVLTSGTGSVTIMLLHKDMSHWQLIIKNNDFIYNIYQNWLENQSQKIQTIIMKKNNDEQQLSRQNGDDISGIVNDAALIDFKITSVLQKLVEKKNITKYTENYIREDQKIDLNNMDVDAIVNYYTYVDTKPTVQDVVTQITSLGFNINKSDIEIQRIINDKNGDINRIIDSIISGGSKSQYKIPSRSFNIFTDILHYYLQFHNKSYNKAVISTHKRLYNLIKQTSSKVEKNNYVNAYYLYNILYSNYYQRNPNLSSKKIHCSLQKILTNNNNKLLKN